MKEEGENFINEFCRYFINCILSTYEARSAVTRLIEFATDTHEGDEYDRNFKKLFSENLRGVVSIQMRPRNSWDLFPKR